MQYPQGKILVFCKAPEPGAVKTRLQRALSSAQCAELHARLAHHTLQTAVDSRIAEIELWCAGGTGHPFFKDCARRYGLRLHPQQGADLGARMAHALQTALRSSAFAIVIGTDCPALEKTHLQTAAEFLAGTTGGFAAARVIIGPAIDGGYVLFGTDRAVSGAFENIDWGSSRVLQQTRTRLQGLRAVYRELEMLADIDRPEDLQHLPSSLAAGLPIPPRRDR